MGSLIHGLHTNDYELISRSLTDVIIEPYRSKLIPYFDEVKKAALEKSCFRLWYFRFRTFNIQFK
jgi:homoserine kinase